MVVLNNSNSNQLLKNYQNILAISVLHITIIWRSQNWTVNWHRVRKTFNPSEFRENHAWQNLSQSGKPTVSIVYDVSFRIQDQLFSYCIHNIINRRNKTNNGILIKTSICYSFQTACLENLTLWFPPWRPFASRNINLNPHFRK